MLLRQYISIDSGYVQMEYYYAACIKPCPVSAFKMIKFTATIFIAFIWVALSCGSKQCKPGSTLQPQTKQDTTTNKASQYVIEDTAAFDFSDFNDLKHNKFYDRFLAGEISLPTGQVVCTDPMYRELALPQSWTINKGQYPVYLYIGLKEDFAGRVAYAELLVKDEIPAYWEMSLISDALLEGRFEREMNGMYPVENGLSCFSDFETIKIFEQEINDFYKLHKDGNYYTDVLKRYFKENSSMPKSSRGEDWINYTPAKAKGNIIMFGSGYGDGLYPRYVGYDRDGRVVKLVTDFIHLKDTASY